MATPRTEKCRQTPTVRSAAERATVSGLGSQAKVCEIVAKQRQQPKRPSSEDRKKDDQNKPGAAGKSATPNPGGTAAGKGGTSKGTGTSTGAGAGKGADTGFGTGVANARQAAHTSDHDSTHPSSSSPPPTPRLTEKQQELAKQCTAP